MALSSLPRLVGLRTYVDDLEVVHAFWRRHFLLDFQEKGDVLQARLGDVVWEQIAGGRFCGVRGPHGALPALAIDDFGHARGHLIAAGIPIVFEEMVPGLNLLIFLDPAHNPFELAQETDPDQWDIRQRKALRTRRRQDAARPDPIPLHGVAELTIYTHEVTASVHFYRDLLGLPVGLSYFAHVHLAAENVAVVLRTTRWRCKAPAQRHGTLPIFALPDLPSVLKRLRDAGFPPQRAQQGWEVRDPAGVLIGLREDQD